MINLPWSFCYVPIIFLSTFHLVVLLLPIKMNWHLWQDIDCMPLNPMENVPTWLARHIVVDNLESTNGLSHFSPSTYPITNQEK